jgi:hypothetical protein
MRPPAGYRQTRSVARIRHSVDLNDALELRQMGDWALGPEIGAMADLDSIDS